MSPRIDYTKVAPAALRAMYGLEKIWLKAASSRGARAGFLRTGATELNLAIRTTRLFKKVDGRWRQVHHHGSIDEPQLLAIRH